MPTLAWTGHRPKDLPGIGYAEFAANLDSLGFADRHDLAFVVGGALGVDSWAATYALTRDHPYHIILPFPEHVMGKLWTPQQQNVLQIAVNAAATYTVIGPEYDVRNYQLRNEAMVNMADHVMACYTGKRGGGTYNCIRYALSVPKRVFNVYPLNGRMREVRSLP